MSSNYDLIRDQSLSDLRSYMDSLPEKKGAILAYWVKDYVRLLKKEELFDPKKLIRYKRGAIVKAHLGFRIGSEEGGLHYAVIVDVCNAKSSPTATVIPLTSVKPDTNLTGLHPSRLYLGDEIFKLLTSKIQAEIQNVDALQAALQKRIEEVGLIEIDMTQPDAKTNLAEKRVLVEGLSREINILKQKNIHCKKMVNELQKMKQGSIALVGQITTISKLRIYDPMYPSDTLSNIRLADETMDLLDHKLIELFTKPTENCTHP